MAVRAVFIIAAVMCNLVSIHCDDDNTNKKISAKASPGEKLQETLDRMASQIYYLQLENNRLNNHIDAVEKRQNETHNLVRRVALDLEEIDSDVESLDEAYENLVKVDAIWRQNFKIINNVFGIIKQKVGFKAQPIRHGSQTIMNRKKE